MKAIHTVGNYYGCYKNVKHDYNRTEFPDVG